VKNRALIAALASVALLGSTARAQETGKDERVLEEARQHVAKAKVHYDLGEFKEAADEYIIVYRLRPIPALLFNIAQAYRQGGLYDKARQFYKAYLRESPDAKNKAMIEQSIREMDELLAKEKRAKERPPNGVKETADASLPIKAAPAQPPSVQPPPAWGTDKPKSPAAVAETPKPAEQSPPKIAEAPKTVEAKPAPKPVPPAVAMATPRPSAPPAATPGTRAPQPQPAAEEGGFYTKWWFWTAVGVVAVGAGVAALTLGGNAPPTSHFGTNGI
jgi:tetratricopeptide (TPR) repeat protein